MTPERAALSGFAVDLGGTKTAAARIVAGEIVARVQAPTDGQAPAEAQVSLMGNLLARLGYQRGTALGIAVSGRVDAQGCWHAVNTGTLADIVAIPLMALASQGIGPSVCLNDGAAAVLAEARYGAGQGAGNLAYVTVSTGIGGGLMIGGRLVSSASGLAGHIGFAGSRLGDRTCGSGRVGTVESVAGGRAIAAAAAESGYPVEARAVSQAALRGEPWAEAIVERSARAVALLIADLVAILGLDRVVLGGSIGLSDGYTGRVRTALAQEPDLFRVPVEPAGLGADAPLYGALAQAIAESAG